MFRKPYGRRFPLKPIRRKLTVIDVRPLSRENIVSAMRHLEERLGPFVRGGVVPADQAPVVGELGPEWIATRENGTIDTGTTYDRAVKYVRSITDPVKRAEAATAIFGRGWGAVILGGVA